MDSADYEQWQKLPHHIVTKFFYWAYPNRGGIFKNITRYCEYDDLIQEANIALVYAWNRYSSKHESGAKFITYASVSMIRRISKFIDENVTVITTKGWQKHVKSKKKGADSKVAAAKSLMCVFFSEMDLHSSRGNDDTCKLDPVEDKTSLTQAELFDIPEFRNHCVTQLKRGLTAKEYQILIEKFSGMSNENIGRRRRYTCEYARKVIGQIMIKATNILIPEIRDGEKE